MLVAVSITDTVNELAFVMYAFCADNGAPLRTIAVAATTAAKKERVMLIFSVRDFALVAERPTTAAAMAERFMFICLHVQTWLIPPVGNLLVLPTHFLWRGFPDSSSVC